VRVEHLQVYDGLHLAKGRPLATRRPGSLHKSYAARLSAPMRHVETDHVVQKTGKARAHEPTFPPIYDLAGQSVFCFREAYSKVAADRQGPRFVKCGGRHSSRWKRREPSRDARERLALSARQSRPNGSDSSANQTKAIAANHCSRPTISAASWASRAIRGGMGARCTSIHPKSAMCRIKAR
jgi:hypothetical protein